MPSAKVSQSLSPAHGVTLAVRRRGVCIEVLVRTAMRPCHPYEHVTCGWRKCTHGAARSTPGSRATMRPVTSFTPRRRADTPGAL